MLSKAIKNYGYLLVALCLALFFFYPFILSDRTFFLRDIHLWFYPMKAFLAESLKSGTMPFWVSNTYCGTPFVSDLQSGLFYPISLVFIIFPFPLSFNLFIVLHFVLGFCFFYQFIKGLGLSKKSALITSISYCYGGYTIASVNTLNNLSTLIWLPAILWSFQRATKGGGRSGYCLTLLFLCMAILGAEPQLVILSVGLLFLFAFTYLPAGPSEKSSYVKTGLIILSLFVSALLLTMVQLGPTYMDYQHSARLGGLAYEEASRHSLNPGMLKHFVIPLRFHGDFTINLAALKDFFPGEGEIPWLLTIYPGLMIVPLALCGLFLNYSKKILLWFSTFIVALVLALGDITPVHYIFYRALPFFRFPDKFMFLASFSLLIMAAYGLDSLISLLEEKGMRANVLTAFLAIILFADLYSTHKNINPSWESEFYQYHHPYLRPILQDTDTFRIHLDPEIVTPPSVRHTINNHHIRWQMMLSPNLGILHGLYHVGGVPALELRYQHLITEILAKPWSEKIHFLKLANVKYIISNQGLDKEPGLKGQIERVNPLLYEIRDYLPRAWMVGQLKSITKGTGDELLDGSFDPRFSALAKSGVIFKYKKPFFERIDDIRYEGNGRIQVELTAQEPGVLVLSESSYPGWRVFVDGEERESLWLNLLFQGVEMGRGQHKVVFIYRPKYFPVFMWISLASLALFCMTWLRALVSTKNETASFNSKQMTDKERQSL